MKKLIGCVCLLLCFVSGLWADSEDTAVFRTRMTTGAEVPPVNLPGGSGNATITVRVLRDGRGAITAATVTFDVDYTMPSSTTFTGLHIHNAAAGIAGAVVINTGISGANSVTGTSGRITRVVTYASTDTTQLGFVAGLLARPDLYYVNLHSTVFPGGVIRGQLFPNRLTFRPAMTTGAEVPPITGLDAQGAAAITIQLNRNEAGAVVSGTVTFDVGYRFPGSVTFTGLHIHNGAAGVNGPVVINSGIGATTAVTDEDGSGNIFRVAAIDANNGVGLAALNGILANPSQYYVNLHTTVHAGGVIRGQLETDTISFMSGMNPGEEVPAVPLQVSARSMVTARATRDAAGNINGGSVNFNVNYNLAPGPVTITGLHIHNAKIGVNGGVVINTGISGTNPVTSDSGTGTIDRTATIESSNAAGIAALAGLFVDPEQYYVNLHTTTFAGGIVRAQLTRETYYFSPLMIPDREIPAITSPASARPWTTIRVTRDANGNLTGGTVNFDVTYALGGAANITGLHFHNGAGSVNGPVVINSGISGTNNVQTATGTGNIVRTIEIAPTNAAGMAALAAIIQAPDTHYINLHTEVNPGGFVRNQLLPEVAFVGQVVAGGDWATSITITNPFPAAAAHGIVKFWDQGGFLIPDNLVDATASFVIPPSGSVTVNTHNKGSFVPGSARIHSDIPVNVDAGYSHPAFNSTGRFRTAVASGVSMPVSVGPGGRNTGVSIVSLEGVATTLNLTLRDASGAAIAGGSRTVNFGAGATLAQFVSELLSSVTSAQYTGTLTIQMRKADASAALMTVTALQFDGANLTPVAVTSLP